MRRRNKITIIVWILMGILVIYLIQSFQYSSIPYSSKNNARKLTTSVQVHNKEKLILRQQNSSTLHRHRPGDVDGGFHKQPIAIATHQNKSLDNENYGQVIGNKLEVVLAAVACGDRLHETLVMIKSAILFSNNVSLRVLIFADTPLIKGFEEKLDEWRTLVNKTYTYEIHHVAFPENGKEEWRKLFKPCAAQRLFLPSLLKQYDSVLYVDTDTLFLTQLEDIWQHFHHMNSSQMAALAPEHEDPNTGWYNRFARHPYYGKLGVNSGVMLMNLTRMRQFGWDQYLSPIYKAFRLKITWGDQDIINIIFHYHPESLYVYSCRYNYRSDHCMYMSVCQDAHAHGVAVVHGSRGTFHSDRQTTFKAIFSALEEYQLGTDAYQNLLLPLENRLDATSHTNCGKVRNIFTKNLHLYLAKEPFRILDDK
ncbi:glucoside xylosyltransferase 1-like isoform X1 [Macrosteles quadrilineatus]|uniref:glucoside xylosyltransferase 1-like isoform X1 n=1 Tax=Macrosteles quadrilineatus TaxID=74068 RepID=UPI0023E23D2B|nr:glucoside xylosyltransferase 1-like isoform X1 [Macrosteles quadrilineatus]